MAVKDVTVTTANNGTHVIAWADVDNGDTGTPVALDGMGATTANIQAVGLSTSTLTVQVSNDGTNWNTADDAFGSPATLSADGYIELATAARHIRPSLAGGTDTDVAVTLVIRYR